MAPDKSIKVNPYVQNREYRRRFAKGKGMFKTENHGEWRRRMVKEKNNSTIFLGIKAFKRANPGMTAMHLIYKSNVWQSFARIISDRENQRKAQKANKVTSKK